MPEQTNNQIILVDASDQEIGSAEKMPAHQKGLLHRCFSIFVFNDRGELLLQQRAQGKYHSAGLWTNTCCSHPRPKKDIKKEAAKRLQEEMGIACPLKEVFSFIYKAKVGELIEHEFDHVFFGRFNGQPKPNPEEVSDFRWVSLADLQKDIATNPTQYTPWLKQILTERIDFFVKLPLLCHHMLALSLSSR